MKRILSNTEVIIFNVSVVVLGTFYLKNVEINILSSRILNKSTFLKICFTFYNPADYTKWL